MSEPRVVDLLGEPEAGSRSPEPGRDPERVGRRLRLAEVVADRDASSSRRVEVVLERGGRRWRGEAEGVGGPQVELRLAAEASISAVSASVRDELPFRLVGVKSIRAFDGELVLVGLRARREPSRRLVGAVPVTDGTARAAAAAVLDALNRFLDPEPRR